MTKLIIGMYMSRPLVLIVLDGWGYRKEPLANAILSANIPNWDNLWATFPHGLISGSGIGVGLREGQMGNSEVGHLNIGAGRVLLQDSTRIDNAILDGSFFSNNALVSSVKKATLNNKSIHIMGLLSPGGVHSHERQIYAMIDLAKREGANKVYVHAFLDGRDTPPKSAIGYINKLEIKLKELGSGKIASIVGRYYSMDRDARWERIRQAYELLTEGKAVYHAKTAQDGLSIAYDNGESDEFVKPTSIHPEGEEAITVKDGDLVVFMNYRADRARELTRAFIEPDFSGFQRGVSPKLSDIVSLTQYSEDLDTSIAFLPQSHVNSLGEVISKLGLKQLRIAETEKYAHVTFFFNGGVEEPYKGEDRILVPSPKVATYDQMPEMSAVEVTDKLIEAINKKRYDLIVCNFANPDMVGHTGNFEATVKAIETIDACLGRIVEALNETNGEAIITADHGNAELLYDNANSQPHTAHTNNPVPFVYLGRKAKFINKDGALSDVAPTILYLLGIEKPEEMTGETLVRLDEINE